jgi:CNT family concentrative nucleoside transporter
LFREIFSTVSRGFVIFLDFSREEQSLFLESWQTAMHPTMPGQLINWDLYSHFRFCPTVIFFSTVSAGLYYLGILQKIVFGIAWVMSRTMRLSGAESLSAAGNIFLGQTEAPCWSAFVPNMTKSELLCLMTGGMATIAGGVLAAYVTFLGAMIRNFGHNLQHTY